jgi:hypothetical protein
VLECTTCPAMLLMGEHPGRVFICER